MKFEEFKIKCIYLHPHNHCGMGWENCCEYICPLFQKKGCQMKEVKVIITLHVHDPICQHSIAKEIENVVKDNIEKSYAKIISVEQETIKL